MIWDFEMDVLELGKRVAFSSDEPSVIEHRIARSLGLEYGCPPRHWSWR